MKSLDDLYLHLLKDIYYAEKQILKALPKMAKAANSPDVKEAFETHRDETEGQIERLETIFEGLEKPARGEKCDAILGIIKEGEDVMEKAKEPSIMDAGLIAAAQAVEHYEIARYGTLYAWAEQLGRKDDCKLIKETLEQEKKTDERLTSLAEEEVNQQAA